MRWRGVRAGVRGIGDRARVKRGQMLLYKMTERIPFLGEPTHRGERYPPVAPWHSVRDKGTNVGTRSEEHTSELQSPDHLVCRLLLVLLHQTASPFPTRRSSDLWRGVRAGARVIGDRARVKRGQMLLYKMTERIPFLGEPTHRGERYPPVAPWHSVRDKGTNLGT